MRFAVTTTIGSVYVLNLMEGVTDAQAEVAKWSPEQQATVASVAACETYPDERTFRDAWTFDPPTVAVVVDMARARTVWQDKMRRVRQPLLDEMDRLWMRATARGDTAAAQAIENSREALRNVTADPAIDAATTPAQLKAVWPDILGPRPA